MRDSLSMDGSMGLGTRAPWIQKEEGLPSITMKGADTCYITDEPGKHCKSQGHQTHVPTYCTIHRQFDRLWLVKRTLTEQGNPRRKWCSSTEHMPHAPGWRPWSDGFCHKVPRDPFSSLSLLPGSLASCLAAGLMHMPRPCAGGVPGNPV